MAETGRQTGIEPTRVLQAASLLPGRVDVHENANSAALPGLRAKFGNRAKRMAAILAAGALTTCMPGESQETTAAPLIETTEEWTPDVPMISMVDGEKKGAIQDFRLCLSDFKGNNTDTFSVTFIPNGAPEQAITIVSNPKEDHQCLEGSFDQTYPGFSYSAATLIPNPEDGTITAKATPLDDSNDPGTIYLTTEPYFPATQ